MATWALARAKAQLSEVVELAATKGPQQITRNGRPVAVLVSTNEWEQREAPKRSLVERRVAEASTGKPKKFVSAWEALRPSFDERYDLELPEREWKSRPVDLG